MQPCEWLLVAEPYEHAVIIVTIVGAAGHIKVADGFDGTGRYFPYRSSDFLKLVLHCRRACSYIFIHTAWLN